MEQVFVERQPQRGAKFLSTFGTNCVSASITQHGPGIIKLAVDVAYELLAQVRVLKHNFSSHHSSSFFSNDVLFFHQIQPRNSNSLLSFSQPIMSSLYSLKSSDGLQIKGQRVTACIHSIEPLLLPMT